MSESDKLQLQKFANNTQLFNAVYNVLLDCHLRERLSADVYVLAASRLAVDYLKQGFKELEKYKPEIPVGDKNSGQIGL